jgi:general secretion pathway protein D
VISAGSKVDLQGKVTVWSNQPVDRNEAIRLLNASLTASGYAATVEGNLLNIYVLDATNAEIIAGVPNNDPNTIVPTKDLVTQIVYVHNVESSQLITSLQPLMPTGTSMSPNQGANAIVITDTKANIRRMVQLVKALDTASVSASTVRVFALTYADATQMAQVVQQLFQTDSSRDRSRFGGFFPGGGGFPFGGGDRGGGDRGGSSSGGSQNGRMTAAKVTAVADDRSNSLVVSASDEQMEMVEKLVRDMDVNVDDIAELRVFRLRHADPQETADQLTTLFPDPNAQQNSSSRSGFRGFGFFGGGRSDRGSSSSSSSTSPDSRRMKQTRVMAVPDPRTSSVIVSASRDLMQEIAGIIDTLDSDPAKKKKVYVIKVENRDPQELVEDLQSVIATDSSSGNFSNNRNNNSRNAGSQLNTRQQQNLQNQGSSSGNNSFGNSSFGSGSQRTGR